MALEKEKSMTEAECVADAAAMLLAGHPYRFLHAALPILIETTDRPTRRFARGVVTALVIRLEKYPIPEPRHLDSFTRIWLRYRAEAEARGDAEVVRLSDRALTGMRVYDAATMGPVTTPSYLFLPATMEATELEYVQHLAWRMLAGRDFLADAHELAESSPSPKARAAATELINIYDRTKSLSCEQRTDAHR